MRYEIKMPLSECPNCREAPAEVDERVEDMYHQAEDGET